MTFINFVSAKSSSISLYTMPAVLRIFELQAYCIKTRSQSVAVSGNAMANLRSLKIRTGLHFCNYSCCQSNSILIIS